ncbi:hypothetical protein FB45DRAFT_245008 [Roridomyces roridus]|uniref:Uncharacterized protein n=1 Tax=Roridomyces roridus TaxID=1738132 RepID=A0AAD7FFH2_9AGAR|nr:hypothetical protein FB45DRAFT_245008 [Roridomyces roridus]
MTSEFVPPTLPPELEREIFKTTAVLHEQMIPALLLVARRAHEWIEPHLYHFLKIPRMRSDASYVEALLRMVNHRPSHFLPQACRHLFLVPTMALGNGWNADDVDRILRACTEVTDIFLLSDPLDFDPPQPFLSTVSQMCPTRLTLFGDVLPATLPQEFHFGVPLFQCITHLQLYVATTDKYTLSRTWAHWPALADLDTLTHLAVFPDQDLATHILSILPHLRALVLYTHTDMIYPDMPRDPRILVESHSKLMKLWRSGARGGDDIWVRADEFIARKRRGEIKESVYRWPEDISA